MKSNPCVRTCRKRDEKTQEKHFATNAIKSISECSRRCKTTPHQYWKFQNKNSRYKNDDIFQNADIIALNETHLRHSDTLTPDMIGLSQDRFIVCCDHNNRGGGVALIINTNLNPKHIRMQTILEIVVVQISEPMQIIVISVYRTPSTPLDVFINGILEVIAQFQNVPICVVGDLNEDVSITSNTCCCTMLKLHGLQQMIKKPTHDSGTIIDHVYVSHTLNTVQTDVTDCKNQHRKCCSVIRHTVISE